jgi:LmbE family N-acetylglucosaminyl deacetylase
MQESLNDTTVLVVAAHPDDAEFGCGGTVARWARAGARVVFLLGTSGDKGSHDPAVHPMELALRREAEQREAARRLGVAEVIFLRRLDGELEVTLAFRQQIALVIRQVQPQIVVTHDPWRLYQLHPDHRAIGLTTCDAIIAAREHLIFPEQLRHGLSHHRPRELYLFTTDHPNVWVDIADTIELKIAALQAHVSQVGHLADLAERVRNRARQMGESPGLAFAEEFHRITLS